MCEKCNDMNNAIARYQRLAAGINDELTISRIKHLITQLLQQKALLHPNPEA